MLSLCSRHAAVVLLFTGGRLLLEVAKCQKA